MDSAAVKIEFTHDANLVKEEKEDEENWFVAWDTTYIFPELGPEDKITYKGSRIKPVLMEEEEKNQVWKESIKSEENAKTVESAMIKVVQDPGTARSANMKDYLLAGKTGTAELKRSAEEKGQENGLFVAYNPESPKLLMAMMIEGVEEKGGSKWLWRK